MATEPPPADNRQAIIPARAVINHAHDLGWRGPLKVKMFDVQKSNKHKPVERPWLDAFLEQASWRYAGGPGSPTARRTPLGGIRSGPMRWSSKGPTSRTPWMQAAGAKLFLETYVHSKDAGRSLADKFDKQSGKIGTIMAQPVPRERYRFGKKS